MGEVADRARGGDGPIRKPSGDRAPAVASGNLLPLPETPHGASLHWGERIERIGNGRGRFNLTPVEWNLTPVESKLTAVRLNFSVVRFNLTPVESRLTADRFNLSAVRFNLPPVE